jgi:tetratricopeptide (TPR) repeat protein
LRQLESRPWLLVLDGLERVLVAYHRYDAAQLLDEDAGSSDEIGDRHPCAAIRPEDEDLLRRLAAASPSKILISSRLVPRVLLNQASQTIPGVLHQRLPGLRPADAEALLRGCGVVGDGRAIRTYLQRHCDCHPLVTGIVAGLVNDYLPARGDFDEWASDVDAGGRLDIGGLDLVQKRNHILRTALAALPDESRQLLSTLAMLSEAVEYDTLCAVCPQLSTVQLRRAVTELEQRGLLQYDWSSKHYDLHPVVRAVASGDLQDEDRQVLGQRVVDHFSARPELPYQHVTEIEELRGPLTVFRTLTQMGELGSACRLFDSGLAKTLLYKLEAAPETLSLLRPFFDQGWKANGLAARQLSSRQIARLSNDVGSAFGVLAETDQALELFETAVTAHLDDEAWNMVAHCLGNVALALKDLNRLARGHRVALAALRLARLAGGSGTQYYAQVNMLDVLIALGRTAEVDDTWAALDRTQSWDEYGENAGVAELLYAHSRFDRGLLTDQELDDVEELGRSRASKYVIRGVHDLRGRLLMSRGEWAAAAIQFEIAISMARQAGLPSTSDGRLMLAHLRLGQLEDARAEIERLHRTGEDQLAELWQVFGDRERAVTHALAAYEIAWADGEPYVSQFELTKAERMLTELGVEIPVLPPYDPTADPPLPCERRAEEAIALLQARRPR